ncbi:hypothetical protein CANARDRAFT_9292 [[Candida] arabinofermentans NRRL YB-2248]|uniref:Major facilitator superfamily (MFS) profile domain-containing protein n=1 Tax=[Candida] arabinofermentans NRRL YB-2248 TaxID=983967 RepID=A0A1E4SW56_9ASCO|nr:hypothetical protein CANARDRAFT_9292 [[Candida] arabinofermentans NRRL YB-2248]
MSEEDKVAELGLVQERHLTDESTSDADIEKAHNAVINVTSHTPSEYVDYTPEEEKAVVRKIDLYVLPFMCFVFFSQYLDKQSLSYAAIFGLKTDLKLVGDQYSWLTSGFYLAQLASQFVYMYLLSKFPIKVITGVCILIWAGVCMCLAAPNSFGGFMAVRALLGFFEGCVSPSFVIVTSVYYKKSEHYLRTAAWISCNAITQVIASYIFYGLGLHEANLKLSAWKCGFLVCGGITFASGFLFYFMIPTHPGKAWFLNERQREIAVHRILAESDRGEKDSWDWEQVKECSTDWLTWATFWFGFLTTVTSGPIIFSTLMINDFGYDKFKTLEYSSPSGAVQLLFIWIGVFMVWLFPKQRCYVVMILALVPLAGSIMLFRMRTYSGWGVIVGGWLGSCITSFYSILLSLSASNVRGNTKKAVVNNVYYVGYALAAIIYPQWWNYSKDPTYKNGLITNIAFWIVFECVVFAYRWKCVAENKARDKMFAEGFVQDYDVNVDLTDKKDFFHRYSY